MRLHMNGDYDTEEIVSELRRIAQLIEDGEIEGRIGVGAFAGHWRL